MLGSLLGPKCDETPRLLCALSTDIRSSFLVEGLTKIICLCILLIALQYYANNNATGRAIHWRGNECGRSRFAWRFDGRADDDAEVHVRMQPPHGFLINGWTDG